MHNANRPEKLIEICENFKEAGAKGVLISGGCNSNGGLLNLARFIPALKNLHQMGLIIKLHTGLVDEDMAKEIANAGVDIASQEIVGDQGTIKKIFNLEIGIEQYFTTFSNLQIAGVPYLCPHLCVGLHLGKLKGEINALKLMKESFIPSTIAIIAFRPTKGTILENRSAPNPQALGQVVKTAREMFPKTKLILGAMRPRSSTRNDPNKKVRLELELAALENGIDGIEIPATKTLRIAKQNGLKIKKIESYGVLPEQFENKVNTSWI